MKFDRSKSHFATFFFLSQYVKENRKKLPSYVFVCLLQKGRMIHSFKQ